MGLLESSFRFQALAVVTIGFTLSHAQPTLAAGPAGELETRYNRLYRLGSETLSPCEVASTEKNLRLALVQALDDRAQDFQAFTSRRGFLSEENGGMSLAPESDTETKVGPLLLVSRPARTQIAAEEAKSPDGWVSVKSGWKDFYAEYLTLRKTPVNSQWLRLLGKVRATLADDERRAIDGISMSISGPGIEETPKLLALIAACTASEKDGALDATKCADLAKPDAFKNAIALTARATAAFAAYAKATDDGSRIRNLRLLTNEIQSYAAYFEPIKQTGVRFSDSETLTVSLDSGDLEGYETELGQVIEKFWKVDGHELKVEWMSSVRSAPLFSFFFSRDPRSGSYSDSANREIHLAQGTYESTPAYEVAHALGFRGRYLSVWRADLCQYEDQSKPADLLSDSRYGSITSAHWDSLKKAYAPTP